MSRAARNALADAQAELTAHLMDALDDLRPGEALTIRKGVDPVEYYASQRRQLTQAIKRVRECESMAAAEWASVERECDATWATVVKS